MCDEQVVSYGQSAGFKQLLSNTMVYLLKVIRNTMKQVPNFPNYTIDKNGVVAGNKIKKQTLGKNGYYYVTLYHNNQSKKLYIHRLLAELYIPNPENKRTVNHIDGSKINNDLSNLEWNTDSENMQHAYDNGLNHGSKITEDLRKTLYNRFMSGESMQTISNDFSFNNVTVSNHIRQYVRENNLQEAYEKEKKRQELKRKCKTSTTIPEEGVESSDSKRIASL